MSIKLENAFAQWYATEGIRTPAPAEEHWHEAYQRMAFIAGVEWLAERYVEKFERELMRQEDEINDLQNLVKRLIRQNRK
jgi:hypothetical protein